MKAPLHFVLSLETFKAKLDGALGSTNWWVAAMGWEMDDL